MSNSLSFCDTDLGTYGLTVVSQTSPDFNQQADYVQLLDRAYPFGAERLAKAISLKVAVVGTSHANLGTNLDSIKLVLNERTTGELILDTLDDRYFNAQFVSFTGRYQTPIAFVGDLDFICPDPLAYDNDETSADFDLDVSDPKTVEQVVGGTGYVKPVYTLTAGDDLGTVEVPITIKVECIEAGEELQWTGFLTIGQTLEINVATWLVRKQDVASMATVTGQFPRLLPGTTNRIKVTGFGTHGDLNIRYRNRFL